MPEISRFYGIVIAMFFSEHNPPHFHARYGDLSVTEGFLPPRVLGLVIEWAAKHRPELIENWNKINQGIQPDPIEPLE
jgi:hypothetical protein